MPNATRPPSQYRTDIPPAPGRLMVLCAIATELSYCDTQDQLFSETGRRLHELDLDLSFWLLTPDGQGIVKQYLTADEHRPESVRELNRIIGADQEYLPFYSTQRDCDLTATLRDGQVRLAESMLDDLAVMRPDLFAERNLLESVFPTWRTMYLPIYSGAGIIGILALHDAHLTEEDRPVLTAFANLYGATLASIRRLEAERAQSERLSRTSRVIAAISVSPHSRRALVEITLQALTEHLPCDHVFVGLVEKGGLHLTSSAADRIETRDLNSIGFFSRVARAGEAGLAHYVRKGRPGWDPALPDSPTAVIAVPLMGGIEGDTNLGVLAIASLRPGSLEEDDLRVLETIAGNFVATLSRIQLYEHTRQQAMRHAQELRTLLEVGRTVARNLDPDKLLDELLSAAINAVGARQGHLLQIVDDGRQVRIAAVIGLPKEAYVGRTGPLENSLLEWVMAQGTPLVIPDTSIAGWYSDTLHQFWIESPLNLLMTPILQGGVVVGGLALTNKVEGTFDEEDVEQALSISLWAAQALNNATLYQRTVERQATLDKAIAQIGSVLASGPGGNEMPQTILRLAASTTNADFGAISLRTETGHFEIVDSVGLEVLSVAKLHLPGAVHSMPAWNPKEPTHIIDALVHPVFSQSPTLQRLGVRSVVSIPFGDADSPIGALSLGRNRVAPFSEDEISFLHALSPHAGVAMQRAQLADDAQTNAHYLQSVLQNTSDAILVMDTAGNTEFLNATAQFLAEAFSDEDRQFSVDGVLTHIEDGGHSRRLWQQFMAGKAMPATVVDVIDRFGATRRFFVHVSAVTPGERYLFVVRETTGDARLDQLRHEFLRHLQHQLGSPLSAVLGFIGLLMPSGQMPKEKHPICVERAYTEAHRVRRLIRELQTYTLLAEPLAHSHVHTHLGDTFALLESHMKREYDISIVTHLEDNVPPVAHYDTQVLYLLQHLTLYLFKLADSDLPPAQIMVHARLKGYKVEISLRAADVYLGSPRMGTILRAVQSEIDQLNDTDASTGLGIALIRRVVEAVGGTLQVYSSERLGTTFALALPASQERDAR